VLLIFAEVIKLVIILSKGHKYEKETCTLSGDV
jgi:hypothetical protein